MLAYRVPTDEIICWRVLYQFPKFSQECWHSWRTIADWMHLDLDWRKAFGIELKHRCEVQREVARLRVHHWSIVVCWTVTHGHGACLCLFRSTSLWVRQPHVPAAPLIPFRFHSCKTQLRVALELCPICSVRFPAVTLEQLWVCKLRNPM